MKVSNVVLQLSNYAVVHWKLHKKSRHKRQLFSGSADCSAGNYNWMGLP